MRAPSASRPAEHRDLFNPLLAFKDRRDYFVAPAGDFEDPSLPGWRLTGGAGVTRGNSPHAVIGDGHASSLSLPAGSSATSPEFCVDLSYPTFRFFVTQFERDTDSDLAVDVIYPALARNNVREAKNFRLKAKDGWKLSDDIKLEPQRLGKSGAGVGSRSVSGSSRRRSRRPTRSTTSSSIPAEATDHRGAGGRCGAHGLERAPRHPARMWAPRPLIYRLR